MTISTYQSRIEALEQLADTLVDRLRSANAVIERMRDAQFNPAILDRIREALEEHRDLRQVQDDYCINCNRRMRDHGPMAECYPVTPLQDAVTDSAPTDDVTPDSSRPFIPEPS